METKTRPYYFDFRYYYQDLTNGIVRTPVLTGTYHKVGDNTVTFGGPVPNWRGLIAEGKNATTYLSGTEHRVTCDPASCDYKVVPNSGASNYYRYRLYGNMMAYYLTTAGTDLSIPSTYLDVADNQARSRFYQHLAEVQSAFKGQTFLGELAESLRMIKHPAQALRKGVSEYLDRLKKVGPSKSKRARPKFVRDTWLEYSFGWKPLISDIEDATRAFLSSRWTKPIFQMVRSTGKNGTSPVLSSLNFQSAGAIAGLYLYYNLETVKEAEVKYYGIYRSVGTGPSTFRHFGFSPWEFVPTLWELIPYSFLVDYFTNIGDIVSAWSYRNIGCEWAAKGTKITNRTQILNARIDLTSSSYYFAYNSGSPGSSTSEYSLKTRTSSVSIPLPDFQWEAPGLGSTKWINIAALSTQLGSTRRSLAR
jgi:hypothetical protein